jgi:hypothetical protein
MPRSNARHPLQGDPMTGSSCRRTTVAPPGFWWFPMTDREGENRHRPHIAHRGFAVGRPGRLFAPARPARAAALRAPMGLSGPAGAGRPPDPAFPAAVRRCALRCRSAVCCPTARRAVRMPYEPFGATVPYPMPAPYGTRLPYRMSILYGRARPYRRLRRHHPYGAGAGHPGRSLRRARAGGPAPPPPGRLHRVGSVGPSAELEPVLPTACGGSPTKTGARSPRAVSAAHRATAGGRHCFCPVASVPGPGAAARARPTLREAPTALGPAGFRPAARSVGPER